MRAALYIDCDSIEAKAVPVIYEDIIRTDKLVICKMFNSDKDDDSFVESAGLRSLPSTVTLSYLFRRAEPCVVAGCAAQKYPAKVRTFPCFEGFVIKACSLFCYAVSTAFLGAGENISNCHFVHCHSACLVSADNSGTAKSFH